MHVDNQQPHTDHGVPSSKHPHEITFQATQQIPRLSVSDVAAISGFNPWKSLENMVEKYLYQDCPELLQLDMSNLGLVVTSEDEELTSIIQKIPKKGRAIINDIKTQIASAVGVNNSAVCDKLLQQAKTVLEQKEVMASLTSEEVSFVRDQFRSGAHTGYGNNRESDVLRAYENVTGYAVQSRNEKFLIAPFMMPAREEEEQEEKEARVSPITDNLTLQEHFMRFATPGEYSLLLQKQARSRKRTLFADLIGQLLLASTTHSKYHHDDDGDEDASAATCRVHNIEALNAVSSDELSFPRPLITFHHTRVVSLPLSPATTSTTSATAAVDNKDNCDGDGNVNYHREKTRACTVDETFDNDNDNDNDNDDVDDLSDIRDNCDSVNMAGAGASATVSLDSRCEASLDTVKLRMIVPDAVVLHVLLDLCEAVAEVEEEQGRESEIDRNSNNNERDRDIDNERDRDKGRDREKDIDKERDRDGDRDMTQSSPSVVEYVPAHVHGDVNCGEDHGENGLSSSSSKRQRVDVSKTFSQGNTKRHRHRHTERHSQGLKIESFQFSGDLSAEDTQILLSVLRGYDTHHRHQHQQQKVQQHQQQQQSYEGEGQAPQLLFSAGSSGLYDHHHHHCCNYYSLLKAHSRIDAVADNTDHTDVDDDDDTDDTDGLVQRPEVIDLTGEEEFNNGTTTATLTYPHTPAFSVILWVITTTKSTQRKPTAYFESLLPKPPILTPKPMDLQPKYPDFYIIGIVDGLSEQLDTRHDCASQWTAETIVIEAKCRVRPVRASSHPPLHDQIQLVTYLLLLRLQAGDLLEYHFSGGGEREGEGEGGDEEEGVGHVQRGGGGISTGTGTRTRTINTGTDIVTSTTGAAGTTGTGTSNTTAAATTTTTPPPAPALHITRIRLDCPVYQHGHHWLHRILPRLQYFVGLLRHLREDASLRYQWLLLAATAEGSEEAKKNFVRALMLSLYPDAES